MRECISVGLRSVSSNKTSGGISAHMSHVWCGAVTLQLVDVASRQEDVKSHDANKVLSVQDLTLYFVARGRLLRFDGQ